METIKLLWRLDVLISPLFQTVDGSTVYSNGPGASEGGVQCQTCDACWTN